MYLEGIGTSLLLVDETLLGGRDCHCFLLLCLAVRKLVLLVDQIADGDAFDASILLLLAFHGPPGMVSEETHHRQKSHRCTLQHTHFPLNPTGFLARLAFPSSIGPRMSRRQILY